MRPCGCPPAGHLMTDGGLSYSRCENWSRREAMGEWVISRLSTGTGTWAWGTWTFRNLSDATGMMQRTRVGVSAARKACDWLATTLTVPAGAGAAFCVVEGWTKGSDDGSPRHHLHSLSKADERSLVEAKRSWEKRHGHVLCRTLSEQDANAKLGEYLAKDATKAMGYFAVGGIAWQHSR